MIFHAFFVKQAILAQFKPGLQAPFKLGNIFADSRLRQFWSILNHVAELRKIPMIIVEHDMDVIMDIADRAIVLDFGRKIAEGTFEEVVESPRVVQAYLGEEDE